MTKESGIIMSGDHPAKVIAGTKTMTRRTYGLELINKPPQSMVDWRFVGMTAPDTAHFKAANGHGDIRLVCPYGGVGDLLWLKETHYRYGYWEHSFITPTGREGWRFVSVGKEILYLEQKPTDSIRKSGEHGLGWYKRPSIFMFRSDSRIERTITALRPERLQEITEEDCMAEGIESRREEWVYQEANGNRHLMDCSTPIYKRYDNKGQYFDGNTYPETRSAGLSYLTLWDKLNGKKYPWAGNWWVWVIDW